VERRIGPIAYRLKLPYQMKQLHPVFNIVKLTPAPDDPIMGRKMEDYPPPIVIDGEVEWEVEEILDSRWHWRRFQYLINVRATGHKAPGESSVNITVSSYDTTHLQENPQRLG